ncbi:MAG TPA: SDR family oxidoreductase [Actinomycetota bacterium]|nr:SDR family oxidoreductase [Actinomycetota bacterium]
MDLGLEGKVAWVLGASSGLGRATARSLATEGAQVAVSARRAELLDEFVSEVSGEGGRALPVPFDVSDPGAVKEAHQKVVDGLGEVDILVANAGGPPPGGFARTDDETLAQAFALTTASAWHLAKAVTPAMKERGSGCIIFLTSSSTKEVIPALLLSNMMRAAVVGLAKTLSKELGPKGIRVLCAAPGSIDTDRLRSLDARAAERSGNSVEDVKTKNQAAIPLRRYGDPKEFGDVVAFLASERASYVNGITVAVDGGALNGILS